MVNKVILIGRVGMDPETKEVGGHNLTKFTLATSEKYKDKDGNSQEKTEWHNIDCWGMLGVVIGKYVHKGDLVCVEGSIRTTSYESDGVKRYSTSIQCKDIKFLSKKEPRESVGNIENSISREDYLPF